MVSYRWFYLLGAVLALGLFLAPAQAEEMMEPDAAMFQDESGQPLMAADFEHYRMKKDKGQLKGRHGKSGTPMHRFRGDRDWNRDYDDDHHGSHKKKVFWLVFLTGMVLVRVLLAVVVFMDLRRPAVDLSGLWVLIVLIGGVMGAIAYALFRLARLQESR